MSDRDMLLGNGPVFEANKLRVGDLFSTCRFDSMRRYQVTGRSKIQVQALNITWSFSQDHETINIKDLDKYGFVHYGKKAPLWKRILTLGMQESDTFNA